MGADDRRAWARALTDPTAFALEQDRLGRHWTLLGFSTDLCRDGDWIRATLGGRSVFVQRFGNALRGFENRCAHRFYPLRTADKGNGPVRCGFHHWQYNKDGRAVGIPHCQKLFGKTPRELDARLKPIEVAVCGTLVFGRFPSPGATDTLADYLGNGFPILEAMTKRTTTPACLTQTIAANWKLLFHITLDDYHIVAVHPDTFGKRGYLDPETVKYFRFGPHSAYFRHGEPDSLARMAAECRDGSYRPRGYRIFQFFPNLLINHLRAAKSWYVLITQYVPLAYDKTFVRTWFYPAPFPAEDRGWTDAAVRRYIALYLPLALRFYIAKVMKEDNDVCERLQTVAHQTEGWPILGREEERIIWFEQAYGEAMRTPRIPSSSTPDESMSMPSVEMPVGS